MRLVSIDYLYAAHARRKSASAPAAPLLASVGEHSMQKSVAHGVSRSSPDTPLSDRLNRSNTATLSRSGGSRGANTGNTASLASGGAHHADEASLSASGSLSDRSINLCFTSGSPGRACRATQAPLYLAAASASAAAAQRACQQGPVTAAGSTVASNDPRGAPTAATNNALLEDWRVWHGKAF